MIKTLQETDTEYQALMAEVSREGHSRLDLFTHDMVKELGNPRQERAKTARGVLRAIQRAQHRGQYVVTVEVTEDGYDITAYTGLTTERTED